MTAKKLHFFSAALSHGFIVLLRILRQVILYTPPWVWSCMAWLVGSVLWLILKRQRERTIRNLIETGYGREEAVHIGKGSFRSNLLVLFESLAMQRMLAHRGIRVDCECTPEAEAVFERIRRGEEKIAFSVSGHTGVWEFMGAEVARRCGSVPVVVPVHEVRNPVVGGFLNECREAYGLHLVERQKFLRTLITNLRANSLNLYGVLCDQHITGGIPVPFMGRTACTVSLPAELILKYGGPVIYARCIRKAAGHYLQEISLMDQSRFKDMPKQQAIREMTAEITRYIQTSIERAPEQWTWGHRRWRECCSQKC